MLKNIANEIVITKVGLQAQWSDSGRRFSQLAGYSQSGAIDWFSSQLANAFCGNSLNTPCIEIMGGHFSFQTNAFCLISITGAIANIHVNDVAVTMNSQILLKPGDNVSLGQLSKGLFNYISFAATFKLPLFRKSVCAVKREKAGGIHSDGMGLIVGEHLEFTPKVHLKPSNMLRLINHNNLPFTPFINTFVKQQFSITKQLPIVFCYQHERFTNIDKRRLLGHSYEITTKLDKMGVRLVGPSINSHSAVLTSQAMANGAIQIPGDGKPIIMRNDRQTIGGYPVIGVVNSLGLAILSQSCAFEEVTFTLTNFESSNISRRFIDIQLNRVLNRTNSFINDLP